MTLPSAVMFWKRLKRWNTMPTSDRCAASSFSRRSLRRSLSRKTEPESTGSSNAAPQQRRLPGAGRPDDHLHLAAPDLDRNPPQHLEPVVGLVDVRRTENDIA